MSNCVWLSDRMPAVAQGRAEWTLDETRHLAQCPSCLEEWELVQVANRLGEGLRLTPEPGVIAESVLQRLKQEQARVHPSLWRWAAVAAAVAFFAALWMSPLNGPFSGLGGIGPVAAEADFPLPELESLQPAELDSVLRLMDEPVAGSAPVEVPDLADLNSDELQRVLDSWEG
jgi:hypothetical protein